MLNKTQSEGIPVGADLPGASVVAEAASLLRGLLSECRFPEFLAIPPFERIDVGLARAVARQGLLLAIDVGRDPLAWPALWHAMEQPLGRTTGLRIPDHVDYGLIDLPSSVRFVVVAGDCARVPADWFRLPVIAQVTSIAEAQAALAAGVAGLVCKGAESGGLSGEEGTFILLQRVMALAEAQGREVPVWCQGGMGLNTAASAFAAGVRGIVLDTLLAGLPESGLAPDLRKQILSMDGSEVRRVAGYQVLPATPRDLPAVEALDAAGVRAALAGAGPVSLVAVGQDGALARGVQDQCGSVETLVQSLRMRIAGQFHQAQTLRLLDADSPWARAHGTRYPVAQGPMTRVSDTAEFCHAVANHGGLPFLALSLMGEQGCRELLESTRSQLGAMPWGVGVLGFAPAEVLNPQLELIRQFRPAVVLLAGGRPSQARPLTDMGIPTYLHVPSPGLLDMFLKDGATHFVFEGRECGGHVGPRYSLVLWQQAIEQLLRVERPEQLHILFAGGIHDARSSAMVAALAAPLAALGAKVGVLMGTAYIATEEAVTCGAILPEFQAQSLAGSATVLVETAPGHAIRCLPSEFVTHFESEKSRLRADGVDAKEAWLTLEQLTVGRLRIASKGIERSADALVPVDRDRQVAEGMYMIGQAITLKSTVVGMADLHRAVTVDATARMAAVALPFRATTQVEPVAIVGMACIYPGAPDLETYWSNILQRKDAVREVPADRWNVEQYYQPGDFVQGKTPSRWGGFVEDTPFDPLEFGIPPHSLAAIEPVQLLSLKVAREALKDANYESRYFDRQRTSVIFGAESGTDLASQYTFRNLFPQYCGDLPEALDKVLPKLTEDSFPGVLVNVISGRIANRLGLGGVNYSVDSACASSLTAIELGVKELRSGSSDMVLAGGADFHNGVGDFLMFASVGALSHTGRCRAFDSTADGIVLGEGVGVVVLKRLADAQMDGDRIYAVIDGIAGSSDGKGLGLTAPRKEGQKRSLERAYWQAGILPASVGLVEAHGTGTVVGDRTELKTLTEVYNAGGAVVGQAGLGSVKSQIGHTKCAAGIAGLIKVAKALHHRVLPPTLHVTAPNAGYSVASSPFTLHADPAPWTTARASAGVSAFGFGGTNFHAVMSAYPAHQSSWGARVWPCELFVFRGEGFAEAADTMAQLDAYLGRGGAAPLPDLALSAWSRRGGAVQCALVASDIPGLRRLLKDAQARANPAEIAYRTEDTGGKLAFLFSGQGSQYPGMLRDFFVYCASLQVPGDAAQRYLDVIFPRGSHDPQLRDAQKRRLMDTRNAQPALGLVEMALFDWLQRLGCIPDMAGGHSFGELAALCSAGAFGANDLTALAEARARAILDAAPVTDPGSMAATGASAERLAGMLLGFPDVVMANQNSPDQTVISGASQSVAAACAYLATQGVAAKPIDTACAFHSPLIAHASRLFEPALRQQVIGNLQWPVYSNATAAPYPNDAGAVRTALAAHVASPVRFVDQINRMYADGARVFVEVGPRQVLRGLVGKILKGRPHQTIALDDERGGLKAMLSAVAQLAVTARGFNADALFDGRSRAVDLMAPATASGTTWMVNGGRAWPLVGAAPAHGAQVVSEPVVQLGSAPAQTAVPVIGNTAEQAMLGYLNNMRELVSAQRDVLQSYFGAPAGASQVVRTVAPVAEVVAPRLSSALIAVPVATTAAAADQPDPRAMLLSIVSERTGYPADMLDLDLDLEADLSIDSIKRIEIIGELSKAFSLRDRLGEATDKTLERLATKKTLRTVLDELALAIPVAPVTVAAPLVAPAAVSAPVPSITELLLDIVSQSTGYPKDVLDLDLDLEADLSIDSIKRVEVVGQLAAHLGSGAGTTQRDAMLEALAPLKTLRAMIGWLESLQQNGKQAADAAPARQDAGAPSGAFRLARYVLSGQPSVASAQMATRLDGLRFLITDDGHGIAPQLAERIRKRGAEVSMLDFSRYQRGDSSIGKLDGLVHLWPLHADARPGDIRCFFALLQESLCDQPRYLVAAGTAAGARGEVLGGAGVAGLLKTLQQERPGLHARMVQMDITDPLETLVNCLEQELLATDVAVEVEHYAGVRQTRNIHAMPLPLGESPVGALSDESVVLITGGGRGITARVAVELARRFRCHFEIVGRSSLPEAEESEVTRSLTDPRELRRVLSTHNKGMRPADIERMVSTILAERELGRSLEAIRQAGASVNYTGMDVRKDREFASFVEALYQRHGRIDAVFHGAGVIEDKLAKDKSLDSFSRVFDTKVKPALVLSDCIRDDVKWVVFFSSVASVFGNRGQSDYAAANDVLDRLARGWNTRLQGAGKVLAVNWGPWAGTGMVSESLEKEYARKGIGLIPLEQGVAALLDELRCGQDAQCVLMCGTPDAFAGKAEVAAAV